MGDYVMLLGDWLANPIIGASLVLGLALWFMPSVLAAVGRLVGDAPSPVRSDAVEVWPVLSDLDLAGRDRRLTRVEVAQINAILAPYARSVHRGRATVKLAPLSEEETQRLGGSDETSY